MIRALVLAAAVLLAFAIAAPTSSVQGEARGQRGGLVGLGAQVFAENCSACHGVNGDGKQAPGPVNGVGDQAGFGPSLRGVGAQAADFYLRTGYMPLQQPVRPAAALPCPLLAERRCGRSSPTSPRSAPGRRFRVRGRYWAASAPACSSSPITAPAAIRSPPRAATSPTRSPRRSAPDSPTPDRRGRPHRPVPDAAVLASRSCPTGSSTRSIAYVAVHRLAGRPRRLVARAPRARAGGPRRLAASPAASCVGVYAHRRPEDRR